MAWQKRGILWKLGKLQANRMFELKNKTPAVLFLPSRLFVNIAAIQLAVFYFLFLS